MNIWHERWKVKDYDNGKVKNFSVVDSYINFQPKRILDIGCGFARESQCFQEKYGSELWLLDGDNSARKGREIRFGSADSMQFYSKIDDLKSHFDSQGLKYNFIDASNIDIPENITFDLIYSFLSCGFHYPANTYMDLINKHSTNDTLIIMDIRHVNQQEDIKIIDIIKKESKSLKCNIKFTKGNANV